MPSFLEQINKNGADNEKKDIPSAPEKEPQRKETVPKGLSATEHEVVANKGYLKKKIITAVVSVLIIAVIICTAWFLIYRSRLVEIKSFSGRSIAEMRKWATEYGIILDEHNIYDESATEGMVISQDAEGGKLPRKSVISVTVSSGVDPTQHIVIPDLINMRASEIREWANKQKLSAVKIIEQYSDDTEKGGVIKYEFSSVSVNEDNFKRNDGLTIYVSKGAEPVKPSENIRVPDYSLVSKDDAEKYNSAFSVTIKSIYSDEIPYGGFISQSVEAGSEVEKEDNKITVYYSLGKPFMPNMAGKSESEIVQMFYELNRDGASLTYEIIYTSYNAPKGQIISCSEYDEYISTGTHIVFSVCKENTGTIVPDFSKISKEDAEKYHGSFTVKVRCIYSTMVGYGKFIKQSVPAGERITDENTEVTVYYSLARPFLEDLVGKSISELPEIFYNLNRDGANLTYRVQYAYDDEDKKGTVIFIEKRNEYVRIGESFLIVIGM